MKTLLLLLSIIFLFHNVMGQISGKFITTDGKPVPFANVLLINVSDSSLVKGVITDETGTFELNYEKPGTYRVRFTGIGYQTWNSESFQLSDSNSQKHLENQIVTEDTQQLGELVVRGQKPFFQQEIDRTVINVESSVLSKGSSALQVLERSPGVYVDKRNNNIALDGKSSVMVMLNGKLMRLPMAQLIALLNSLSADDIEKIELITSPPAKYDADGSAGLINIVLKKREEIGTTGSLSATAGYGWREKGAGSLSLSHNTGRMNMYGSYSVLHDHGRDGWDATGGQNMPAFGGELKVDAGSHTNARSNGQNGTVGYDLNFRKLTTGGSINFSSNKANRDISNYGSYTLLQSDSVLLMRAKIIGKSRWTNVLSSVYLDRQLREGETININLDYLRYNSENPTEGRTSYFDKSGRQALPKSDFFSDSQKGISSSPIHVGVAKVDYVRQLTKKLKVEAGIKGTLTRSSSLSTIENLVDGEWIGSTRYTNDTDMKENIGAVYSSFNIAVNPKINLIAGLRYEYSHTYSDAAAEQNRINRKLSKFFPSFFLSKKVNDQSELQFSYTKRISRPSFNDLSSYLLYIDPMSVATGNPSLRPTIASNIKIGYNYKGLAFSLLASREKNPIVLYQLRASPANDLMYNAPENMAYQNSLMFQANLPVTVTNWWNMSLGIRSGFRQFKLDHTVEKLKKTYATWSVNGSQTFTLPKKISLELSGFYNGKQYEGSKKIDGFGMLNAGVKADLNNNWGSVQLSVTDLFKSMRVSGHFGTLTEEAFSLYAHFIYKAESANYRVVKLTYSRSFGNVKVKGQKQATGARDEQDRIRKN